MKYDFDQTLDRRNTESYKWDFAPEDAIPMWVADMDFRCLPEITEAMLKRVQHPIYGYTSRSKETEHAVLSWLKKRHGWKVESRSLVFCPPGVIHALSTIVMMLTEPGDRIVLQPPIYGPLYNVVEGNGRKVLENPLHLVDDKYRMDLEQLRKHITCDTKMLILCSPHNPTGRVWAQEELLELLEIARKNDIFIVSDEIHSDLIYTPNKHYPLGSLPGAKERAITLFSANKTFNLGGLAHAMVVIDNDSVREDFIQRMLVNQTRLENIFTEKAMIAGYTFGEDWLEQLNQYLAESVREVDKFLKNNLPEVHFSQPEGTYLLWLDFSNIGLSHEKLKWILENEAKVFLTDGREFGPGGENHFRMNIACTKALTRRALERISNVLAKFTRLERRQHAKTDERGFTR